MAKELRTMRNERALDNKKKDDLLEQLSHCD